MRHVGRKTVDPTARALTVVARRLNLHLRLAREMYREGYLKINPKPPEDRVNKRTYTHQRAVVEIIGSYFGISIGKAIDVYNKGYLDLNGFDYEKEILRYLQRKSGELSVRLLCYLAYDEIRPGGGMIKNQKAVDCLSALKIDGKLRPPAHLAPYLDDACKGQREAMERVARWMRDLIESVGKPHGWHFYGVRLALVEGSYVLWTRPVPKLRRLRKLRKLAERLREHPLLCGCVTPVAKPGRNKDYFHMFHRPGRFWDL